ncbi:MAG: integration host factor subunit alpha [Deltaproteobacteria bacterium]
MTLTKARLINSICSRTGLTKSRAAEAVETLFEVTKKTLEDGEDILISGFGKFCVREKGSRKGRNPRTGNHITLESRKVVNFKCSSVLKERINQK